jgi:hypothetical protein
VTIIFDEEDLNLLDQWINTTTLHQFDREKLRKAFARVASKHPGMRLNAIEEHYATNRKPYSTSVFREIIEIASEYFPPQ